MLLRVGDGFAVVTVSGALDVVSAPALRALFLEVAASSLTRVVVVDMAGVTFVDSTALGLFVGLSTRLTKQGSRVLLGNLDRSVGKTFVMTGVDKILPIHWLDGPAQPWESAADIRTQLDAATRSQPSS